MTRNIMQHAYLCTNKKSNYHETADSDSTYAYRKRNTHLN